MVDNDNDRNVERLHGRNRKNIFDDDRVVEDEEDVVSIQEPYPVNDTNQDEVENPDEHHEYDDTDHPHEYRPPSAVLDDYLGASGGDRTNAFEQQNPLQSNLPSSDRDR